jgi:hypothetical protein
MEDLTHQLIKELYDNHGPSFTDLKNFAIRIGHNDSEAKVSHVKFALNELEKEGLVVWHTLMLVERNGKENYEEFNKNTLGTQGIDGLINFQVFKVEARLTLKGLDYAIDFFNKESMHLSALATNKISRISNWAIGLFTLVLAITGVIDLCFKINQKEETKRNDRVNEVFNKTNQNIERLNSSVDSLSSSLKLINRTLLEKPKTKTKSVK